MAGLFSVTDQAHSFVWKHLCSIHRGFNQYFLYKFDILWILIMKGDAKKRKTMFKRGWKGGAGGQSYIKVDRDSQYVRPTAEEAELLAVDPVIHNAMASTSTAEDQKSDFMILRPRSNQPQYKSTNSQNACKSSLHHDCYKIFHVAKLLEMFNTVYLEHRSRFPKCPGSFTFDNTKEERRGVVWRERMTCGTCMYTSEMHKLYTEVSPETKKRGRKMATANLGLNIALTQTPIGGSSLVHLLAGGNIGGPLRRGLANSCKVAGDVIVSENKADMSNRLQQLRKINRWQGRPENVIPVQIDGVYNNNLYSGVGKTPFQPASQCTVTVAENITPRKQIVAVETVNKVCSKHGFHTQDDMCDIKAGNCSATASMETNIGEEQRWAEKCFRNLKAEGMEVKYVTSDGDGKSYEAANQLYLSGVTKTAPIHQLDTRHLSANHRKFIKASSGVTAIMPGGTKAYRQYLQNRFSIDMSQRCHAELQCLIRKSHPKILEATRDIMSTIKQCYAGNHSLCKINSAVCKGKKNDNWLSNSIYLRNSFKIDLQIKENETVLMEVIEYRLADNRVDLTRLNTNSQKVEATNRAIKRSLPKYKTFSRNFESRAHSALHSVNNGPGNSVRKLCSAAGCPIPPGTNADTKLLSLQSDSEIKRKRENSMEFKQKRRQRRQRLFDLYEKHREQRNYIKNQLTRTLRKARAKNIHVSHSKHSGHTIDHDAYARTPMRLRRRTKNT